LRVNGRPHRVNPIAITSPSDHDSAIALIAMAESALRDIVELSALPPR
jgi:hypothetical protein